MFVAKVEMFSKISFVLSANQMDCVGKTCLQSKIDIVVTFS